MPAPPGRTTAFLAALVVILSAAAQRDASDPPEQTPDSRPDESTRHSFFSDYYFRVIDGEGAWPYFGGHDDALGDLTDWKFSTPGSPDRMELAEVAAGLESAVHQALNWRRDGLDLWFKQRLFVEVAGLLNLFGAYPVHISPRTCEEHGMVTEEGSYGAPWVPPTPRGDALSADRTDDLAGLARILCRAIQRDFDNAVRESNHDLQQRYFKLDQETRFLDGPAARLLDGVALEELPDLTAELADLPPASTVLSWVEEFDTLMGLQFLRMHQRPDWTPLGAAFGLEAVAPAGDVSHLVDCRRWIPSSRVKFEEGRFLDSFAHIEEDYLWFQDDHPFPFKAPIESVPPAQVAARIGVALFGLAFSSAEKDDIELLRRETATRWRPHYVKNDPPTPRDYSLVYESKKYTYWVGNPLALGTIMKRRVERELLVEEFGTSFGNALADHRNDLRSRILDFDPDTVSVEKLLYTFARLGFGRFLTEQINPVMATRMLPWLTPGAYGALFQAWPSVVHSWRSEPLYDLVRDGLGAFKTMRDLPVTEIGIFKIRALEDLVTCIEPLLSPEQLQAVESEFRHARQNFLDRLHAELQARIEGHCSLPGAAPPDVLHLRGRDLVGRLLPDGRDTSLDELVHAFSLSDPCGTDLEAVLLRFGALYDLMTAVFALESHAAGGAFDSPFDRGLVLSTGRETLLGMERQLATDRAGHERALMGFHVEPEDPADPVPELAFAPETLFVPTSMSKELHALIQRWHEALESRLSGRPYPDDILLTGWRPLDDYIEEEERHRRIDLVLQRGDDPAMLGFELRTVFSHLLPYGELLDGEGAPAPRTQWISWRRVIDPARETDAYVIEYGIPGDSPARFVLPVPVHHRTTGPRTLASARSFAEIYLRTGP